MKVAFLDRDGTINRDYPDEVWSKIAGPEILDGAIGGMKHILEKGYKIIIITNQYTIGEGYISVDQYHDFQAKLIKILERHGVSVLDTFYCPHSRVDNCACCKPRTGMIDQALQKYPDIDIAASFMCGDSAGDMLCAKAARLRFIGINIGDVHIKNLSELNRYI